MIRYALISTFFVSLCDAALKEGRIWTIPPICLYIQNLKMISSQIIFKKVRANSQLHTQVISETQTKCSGVGVDAVGLTPTPTPEFLQRLRANPAPAATPHPWWYLLARRQPDKLILQGWRCGVLCGWLRLQRHLSSRRLQRDAVWTASALLRDYLAVWCVYSCSLGPPKNAFCGTP